MFGNDANKPELYLCTKLEKLKCFRVGLRIFCVEVYQCYGATCCLRLRVRKLGSLLICM